MQQTEYRSFDKADEVRESWVVGDEPVAVVDWFEATSNAKQTTSNAKQN